MLLEMTSNVAGQIYAAHMRVYGKQFSGLIGPGMVPERCAAIAKRIVTASYSQFFNNKK